MDPEGLYQIRLTG